MSKKYLIIGAVACGTKAASKLRRLDNKAEIVLIDKSDTISYGACGMPYYISDEIKNIKKLYMSKKGIRDKRYFEEVKKIDKVYVKTEAIHLDPSKKTVTLKNLETDRKFVENYDKLIIATGANPILPPLEGVDAENVFTLKKPESAVKIKKLLTEGKVKNVTVVGAGMIGIELAEAIKKYNVSLNLVDMADRVLPALFDHTMAVDIHNKIKQEEVNLILNAKVKKIIKDSRGRIKAISINNKELETDLVIFAAGFKPNTALAQKAGLQTASNGALLVDNFLKTSNPNIYAGGDCVMNKSRITGENVYLPLGDIANIHGRLIAQNIHRGNTESFDGVIQTAITRFVDLNIGSVGLTLQKAKELGYDVISSTITGNDKAGYYSTNEKVKINMVADKKSHKILGARIIGNGNVAKLINTLSMGLYYGIDVETLQKADLAYSPPFAPVLDNLIIAANVLEKKLAKRKKNE